MILAFSTFTFLHLGRYNDYIVGDNRRRFPPDLVQTTQWWVVAMVYQTTHSLYSTERSPKEQKAQWLTSSASRGAQIRGVQSEDIYIIYTKESRTYILSTLGSEHNIHVIVWNPLQPLILQWS